MTEDEIIGWHHVHSVDMSLSKFQELALDSEAWRAAARGHKELDTAEQLNWTESKDSIIKKLMGLL